MVSPQSSLGARAALSLSSVVLVYCLLSTLVGPAGLVAYRDLEARSSLMGANLQTLSDINARLGSEIEALRSDADRAAREARGLGYLKRGETEIVLAGASFRSSAPEVGRVLPLASSPGLPDGLLKELAFAAGLAIFLFTSLARRRRAA